jgi:hypothetical protein
MRLASAIQALWSKSFANAMNWFVEISRAGTSDFVIHRIGSGVKIG